MEDWLENIIQKFEDPTLDEVLVNGCKSMELISGSKKILISSPFELSKPSTRRIQDFSFSQRIRLDPIVPSAGGSLNNGEFRWHAVIHPAAAESPLFSLRRHRFTDISLDMFDYERESLKGNLEKNFMNGCPILICGPTGSGKSTLMTSLLSRYSSDERVIILETTSEIPGLYPSWIRLLAKGKSIQSEDEIPISLLLSESLRLRPDRIVVGEIRGSEAAAFFDCIATGHRGAISTIHSSSVIETRNRIVGSLLKEGYSEEYSERMIKSIEELCCIFLGRGSPPKILKIEKLTC